MTFPTPGVGLHKDRYELYEWEYKVPLSKFGWSLQWTGAELAWGKHLMKDAADERIQAYLFDTQENVVIETNEKELSE